MSHLFKTILIIFFGAVVLAGSAYSEEPQFERKWTFHGKNGEIGISVARFVHDQKHIVTSMAIWGDHRTEQEEVGFVSGVLDQLLSYGIRPDSLGWIELRFQEPEARRRVAGCIAALPKWRTESGSRAASRFYPLVTSCMIQSNAYQELAAVFRKRGLKLAPVGVEKVLLEPFNNAGAACPNHIDCTHLLVPRDALVQLNIETVERH